MDHTFSQTHPKRSAEQEKHQHIVTAKDDGQFVVQPNFQILCIGPVPLGALALAEVVAERRKVEMLVVEYALERKRFLTSLQQGLDGNYAVTRLQSLSANPLPQNVLRSLEEWVAEMERIRAYEGGVFVEIESPDLLKAVLKRTPFKSQAIQLSDRHVLIPPDLVEKLFETLGRKGIYPIQVNNPDEELVNSVDVDETGVIRPRLQKGGLFLEGTLRRIAVPGPDNTWQLTQESVKEAAQTLGTEGIVKLLERLSGEKLPKRLKQHIYLWSGLLSRVRAEPVVLLYFADAQALEALRSFPGLSRLIRPISQTGKGAIARVKEEDFPKVLSRLHEFGVEIEQVPE